jgi:hypothetical protein
MTMVVSIVIPHIREKKPKNEKIGGGMNLYFGGRQKRKLCREWPASLSLIII